MERLCHATTSWVQNVAGGTIDFRPIPAWTCSGPVQLFAFAAILEDQHAEIQGASTTVSWIRCNCHGQVALSERPMRQSLRAAWHTRLTWYLHGLPSRKVGIGRVGSRVRAGSSAVVLLLYAYVIGQGQACDFKKDRIHLVDIGGGVRTAVSHQTPLQVDPGSPPNRRAVKTCYCGTH
jgi:hypothetical protein